jgi:hypothetical protein
MFLYNTEIWTYYSVVHVGKERPRFRWAKIRGKITEIERSIWWGARETTWKVLVGYKMFWMGKTTEIDIYIYIYIFFFFPVMDWNVMISTQKHRFSF